MVSSKKKKYASSGKYEKLPRCPICNSFYDIDFKCKCMKLSENPVQFDESELDAVPDIRDIRLCEAFDAGLLHAEER